VSSTREWIGFFPGAVVVILVGDAARIRSAI